MKKRLWDLGAGRLTLYRPASLHESCDIMAKTLMGASSVQAKPVPVHTKTKRQRKKKPVFLFSLTHGLQTDLYKTKDRLLASQGRCQVQGRRYFPEASRGDRDRVPGSPPSWRPARLRLDVRRAFLVEGAGAAAAALTLSAALDSATGGAVDLHQQVLISIEPEGQELSFGQAARACERFPPLADRKSVV